MNKLIRIINLFNYILALFCGALVLVLMFITTYDVVARYLFDSPTRWASELATFIVLGIGFLGGGFVLKEGGHVKIDLIYQRFSSKKKAIVDIFGCMVGLFFCSFLMWQAGEYAWDALEGNRRSLEMMWPLFPVRLVVPIGSFLLSIALLCLLYQRAIFLINDKGEEI